MKNQRYYNSRTHLAKDVVEASQCSSQQSFKKISLVARHGLRSYSKKVGGFTPLLANSISSRRAQLDHHAAWFDEVDELFDVVRGLLRDVRRADQVDFSV